MNSGPLTIWCNAHFPEAALAELRDRLKAHRLIFPEGLQKSNLVAGGPDPLMEQADVAFGQPDPQQSMRLAGLKWVHLTSAGYTRYDRDDLRLAFRQRGSIMTNSSSVYAEPCAEHVVAMMLAMARQLPQCLADQFTDRSWNTAPHREACRLLVGQRVLILGFGAIGARVAELLEPFRMQVTAVRRRPTGGERCPIIPSEKVDEFLPLADHVVNILPASAATENYFDRRRLERMKPAACFYNIGRGTTVDQAALAEALRSGKLAGAYLDVTDPEPLPPDHALWSAPHCYITPHTAGGHVDEFERLVRHFADNFDRWRAGKPVMDQII